MALTAIHKESKFGVGDEVHTSFRDFLNELVELASKNPDLKDFSPNDLSQIICSNIRTPKLKERKYVETAITRKRKNPSVK